MRKLRILRKIAKIVKGEKKKTNPQLGLAIFAKNRKNRRTLKSKRTLVSDKSRGLSVGHNLRLSNRVPAIKR